VLSGFAISCPANFLQIGPSISCPAISRPAILMVRHFHVRHFQSTHSHAHSQCQKTDAYPKFGDFPKSGQISSPIWLDLADAIATTVHSVNYG